MTEIFTMTKTCARESAVASAEPPPDLTVPDPISFRTNLADRALVFKPQMELRQIEQYLRQPEGSLNCLMRLDYPMKLIRLFLVKMSPVTGPVTRTAVREAFPGAEVVEVKTVEEAAQSGPVRPLELVVLAEPDTVAASAAIQTVNANGLPRWAVVILGRDLPDLAETVPPEEWNAPLLARVFRAALMQHELLSENLRLHGDLRTVAHRISHDLYTPVGCISTSAHVLKLILSENHPPATADMIRNIETSSAEISQLIDRVSFVLRASADPCPPVPFEMAEVVAEVLQQLEPEIRKNEATVTQPASWPKVNGVPQWLRVIWWNLLGNALRHGGPAVQVRLSWQPVEDGWQFSVADRGGSNMPVSPARLFRPFDQLHLLPAPGLGLSIVQRLVALQGGRCDYEQQSDGASLFSFTLPGKTRGRQEHESVALPQAFRALPPKSANGFPAAAPHATLPLSSANRSRSA